MARGFLILGAMAILAAFSLLTAAGCGDGNEGTISADEHARIQKGMTLDDVEAVAGSPERSHKTGSTKSPNIIWYYSKTDGDGLVRISFVDGKVDVITPYDQSVTPEE